VEPLALRFFRTNMLFHSTEAPNSQIQPQNIKCLCRIFSHARKSGKVEIREHLDGTLEVLKGTQLTAEFPTEEMEAADELMASAK